MKNYDIVIIEAVRQVLRLLSSAKRNGIESILILERDKETGRDSESVYSQRVRTSYFQRGTDRPGIRTEIY